MSDNDLIAYSMVSDEIGDFVIFSCGADSISLPFKDSIADMMLSEYVAVFQSKAEPSHYRYARGNELCYPPVTPSCMTLHEFFVFMKSASWIDWRFFRLLRKGDEADEFIKSYMPRKRGSIGFKTRQEVYAKCAGHCAYCGKPIRIDEMQVDHVDSHYRHHGIDDISNYLPACRDCNGLKSDYLLEEFRNVLIPNCSHANPNGNTRASRICKAYKLKWSRRKIVFYFEEYGIDIYKK